MCELYAVSSQGKCCLNQTLRLFYQHSVKHPHGWGLAYWEDGRAVIQKEELAAFQSEFLQRVLEKDICSEAALAHIRFATVGGIGLENCHPFAGADSTGRPWTLIHNGTMFCGIELIPYEKEQKGQTDSERILLYLLDHMGKASGEKGRPLSPQERIQVMEDMVRVLAPRNKLNLLIYDSERLYVHTNMKDTLFYAHRDGACYFATNPLETGWSWQNVPMNTLLVYQNGRKIHEGSRHPYECVSANLHDVGNFEI